MSRSRKKVPGWVDRNPWAKNYANRRLRRIEIKLNEDNELTNEVVPNFRKFKKYSETWNIRDWRSCLHSNAAMEEYLNRCVEWRRLYGKYKNCTDQQIKDKLRRNAFRK
jgi:hypothetical protein